MKSLLATFLIALLAGCATGPIGPQIDRSLTAKGQASRVRFVVLHYTVSDRPTSIRILTQQQVSSHYLLTDDPQPMIYGLVDETNQSYHAGLSSWKGFTQLNTSSIGIEIVNPGWVDTPQGRVYAPFHQAQIDRLIVLLKDIVKRHNVTPENILGHSDIAPLRKQDPGPMFPWYQLAQAGLIKWPDPLRVAAVRPAFEQYPPDVGWYQAKLVTHGFALPRTGVLDEATRTVLSAFQMKYRPANIGGIPDAETAALLEVLTTPATPLAPTVTAGTRVPAAPATAVFRAVPAPAAPVAPAAPAATFAPAVTAVPVVPAVPEAPAAPEALAVPEVPAAPAALPAPVAPATPVAPVAPATPSAMQPQ
jgi:N-acetylmuramoyl-L-alanine amidase